MRSALAVVTASLGIVASVATSGAEDAPPDLVDEIEVTAVGLPDAQASSQFLVQVDGFANGKLSDVENARALHLVVKLFGDALEDPAPDGQRLHVAVSQGPSTTTFPLTDVEPGALIDELDVSAADGEVDLRIPIAEECAEAECSFAHRFFVELARADDGASGPAQAHLVARAQVMFARDEIASNASGFITVGLDLIPDAPAE